MAKDKDAKKKSSGSAANAGDKIKSVAMNPMVQEVVAAALVATAAALKDNKKARAMAEQAGDQLEKLAGEGAERGKALWALALDVAKRAGDMVQDSGRKAKSEKAAKPEKTAKPAKAGKREKSKKSGRKAKAQK